MRLGMLHLFENPSGRTEHEIVKEQFELMYAAEDLGFDSIQPAEHHFSEYGYLASPQVSLAAVAARTKRIRLGTGVVVLPFHNPIRVAEDFALLDLMSDGRVDLGVGRGYQPMEFAGFGVDQTKSREMFDEGIKLVQKCWTEDRVTFHGKHYTVDDLCVRPKPLQQPHPPIYMACLSPETFAIAGAYGLNIFMSSAFGLDAVQAKQGVEAYRKARAENGFDPQSGQIANLFMIYAADSMEQARADFSEPVTWYYRTIAKYVSPPVDQPPVPGYERYQQSRKLASQITFDELVKTPVLACGDVDHCVERVTYLAREYGFNEMLCWTRIGGMDRRKVQRAMELISGKIIPRVKKELGTA